MTDILTKKKKKKLQSNLIYNVTEKFIIAKASYYSTIVCLNHSDSQRIL